jgi:hypothetical protein
MSAEVGVGEGVDVDGSVGQPSIYSDPHPHPQRITCRCRAATAAVAAARERELRHGHLYFRVIAEQIFVFG